MYRHVTPDRFAVIKEFYEELVTPLNTTFAYVEVPGEDDLYSPFEATIDNFARLCECLNLVDVKTLYKSKYKVLLPNNLFCCNKMLNIIHTYANIRVYTSYGIQEARSYHGKCRKCKRVYYHGLAIDKNTGIYTFDDFEDTILFSTGVAFSKEVIQRADDMICIGNISFERTASILDANYGFTTNVNPDRLESAWFLFRILEFVREFNWPRKNSSGEFDLEELCKMAYARIKNSVDNEWLHHKCSEVGCNERFVVMDGNAKLYRSLCGANKSRVIGKNGEVNGYNICIRNPTRGNQHGSSNTFCSAHHNDKDSDTDPVLDLRPVTRSMTNNVPVTITNGEGCKSNENIERFYRRTAGMFYLFRPCGIRLSNFEMYTAESLSDVFKYIVDVFGEYPTFEQIRGLVYDRCCELKPFLQRLAGEGNDIASRYLNLLYIVDIFHAERHTEAKCVLNSGSCEFHPHLPEFEHVRKMNTEIAEQSFKELNMIKCTTRKMTYAKRILFLKFIDHSFNKKTVERRKRR